MWRWVIIDLRKSKIWMFASEREAWLHLEDRRIRVPPSHKEFIVMRGLYFDLQIGRTIPWETARPPLAVGCTEEPIEEFELSRSDLSLEDIEELRATRRIVQ
jgi:hypothetical protein